MASLNDQQKAGVFKMMAEKSAYKVGLEYGLDKYYKNARTVGAIINKIYNEVRFNPEKFGFSQDAVDIVVKQVENRTIMAKSGKISTTLREQVDAAKDTPIEKLALDNRQKAAMLLSLKLDDALSAKKKRDKLSIGELAKVYGIAIDKVQILDGKATEHVAIQAKINTDISAEDAIAMVLRMREYNNAVQQTKD